jgi:putative addiction module component (TIGR02574 family)
MTRLLQQAITEVQKLPEQEQDAIAALILEELADERRWDEQFSRSQEQLARIAEKVRAKIKEGGAVLSADDSSVFDLSPSEKFQLVQDLWDDLSSDADAVPVHDWQKKELDRRKANLLNNPASAVSWENIKERVRSRYGR